MIGNYALLEVVATVGVRRVGFFTLRRKGKFTFWKAPRFLTAGRCMVRSGEIVKTLRNVNGMFDGQKKMECEI